MSSKNKQHGSALLSSQSSPVLAISSSVSLSSTSIGTSSLLLAQHKGSSSLLGHAGKLHSTSGRVGGLLTDSSLPVSRGGASRPKDATAMPTKATKPQKKDAQLFSLKTGVTGSSKPGQTSSSESLTSSLGKNTKESAKGSKTSVHSSASLLGSRSSNSVNLLTTSSSKLSTSVPGTLTGTASLLASKSTSRMSSLLTSAAKTGLFVTAKPPLTHGGYQQTHLKSPSLSLSSSSSPLLSTADPVTSKTSSTLSSGTKEPSISAQAKSSHPRLVGTARVAVQVEENLASQAQLAEEASRLLPRYSLGEKMMQKEADVFIPPESDANVVGQPGATPVDIPGMKRSFINAISASLLSAPDFHDPKHPSFKALAEQGERIAKYDAEFILKVALYTRCNLNIRTTANFLLALASNLHSCRPHLRKYFPRAILLPSDWIEVAEVYQAFHDKSLNFGSLPTALRKAMMDRFPGFDAYQLAKYNKESSRKKKQKKNVAEAKDDKKKPVPVGVTESSDSDSEDSDVVKDEESETEEELQRMTFTLKQLIRKLHITKPVDHIMSILGKHYPEDPEAYRRSGLPGMWDQDRAGKRMKLPTPETWETQVSMKGNKSEVWEDLIDHRKLPFMAMLRNLRNLILANISSRHHQWVLRKLKDERAVVNSKQFPFRFFSAFEVLVELEKICKGEISEEESSTARAARMRAGKGRKKKKLSPSKHQIDLDLIPRYHAALNRALEISTCYNVKPIPGSTLILCNVGRSMNRPCTSARGLGKPRTVQEVGVLLGLMCKYSCESCTMWMYGKDTYKEVQLTSEGTILTNLSHAMSAIKSFSLDDQDGTLPCHVLEDLLVNRDHIDNLLVLTDTIKQDSAEGQYMADFLKKYRRLVNPRFLFVNVDLSGKSAGFATSAQPQHENDIYLAGYSDQILRFIAERGDDGQLTFVQNIDKVYDLKSVKRIGLQPTAETGVATMAREKAFIASGQARIWRTVRVFISSTFKDMHGERDLLTRYVFPELRARAHAHCIQLYEVDLRWGVTEEESRSERALEICLGEISRCQYFVCMLGDRYGWSLVDYKAPATPEYEWLAEYPPGRSITEVEIYHAALADPEKAQNKAFFFFRDAAFMSEVPEEHHSSMLSETFETKQKMENLKSRIRTSGLEVYDGYPARWLGTVEGRCMTAGLEDFGKRVLAVLWNRIQKDYPLEDPSSDPMLRADEAHTAYAQSEAEKFVGRQRLMKQALELVTSGKYRLIMGSGKPGSGKSAFMSAFLHEYTDFLELKGKEPNTFILYHFIGAAPDSGNLDHILRRLCYCMKKRFTLPLAVPEDVAELVLVWPEFLKETSEDLAEKGKLLVIIDGLDLLEDSHGGRALEWLPTNIPENIMFFVSCREGQSAYSILQHRTPPPTVLTIGALDIFDKAEMIRRRLGKHKKRLDESAFNNQMKLLLSKRDAVSPLYLHLVCEELRVFGVFEEVSNKIRRMAATVPGLLQEILQRLEEEHGQELVTTAMSLLAIARDGLQENELSSLLAVYSTAEVVQQSGIQKLPPLHVAQLFRSLLGYLQPTSHENSDLLTFSHPEIEKAVRQRYMKGVNVEFERTLHTVAALYFRSQADPQGDGSFKGKDPRAFSELPYHLLMAGMFKDVESMLTNLAYVSAKAQFGLSHRLLEDYIPNTSSLPANLAREVSKLIQLPAVEAFRSFVSRNLHIIRVNPALVLQQAFNEASDSILAKYARVAVESSNYPVVEWVNKTEGQQPCQLTITAGLQEVNCVAFSPNGQQFACGMLSCAVKVFEIGTGREVVTFTGHAAAVTGIAFVGSGRLCSCSKDLSLSLWDLQGGHRIQVMKEHTRSVQDCVANASGKTIVSASYDGSLCVWNGSDGSLEAKLVTQGGTNRPLNCVSFHPDGQLVVAGGWDCHVKIWDTFNQKRVKVMRGHKTSVQACAYSPTGRHVVSASMDGEVKLWTTASGRALGTISGHCLPVQALAFSSDARRLFTASKDQTIKVWSGSLGTHVLSCGEHEFGAAHSITVAPEGSTHAGSLFVGYQSGYMREFDMKSGALLLEKKLHDASVTALHWCPPTLDSKGVYLATASVDKTCRVWAVSSAFSACVELQGHSEAIRCVVWTSALLATGSEDLTIKLWPYKLDQYKKALQKKEGSDARTLEALATLRGHRGPVTSLVYDRSRKVLLSASQDQSIMMWDVLSHQLLNTMHSCHKDWINSLALSDLSKDYLLSGSSDFTLKLWDLKDNSAKTVFTGHLSAISHVDFVQGCVVSSAVDGTVKVWTHKGVEVTTLHCHGKRVNACLLHIPEADRQPSGSWADMMEDADEPSKKHILKEVLVVTASDDGTVSVWRPFVSHNISTLIGHAHEVTGVAISNGGHVLSGSVDKTLRVWSAPTHPHTTPPTTGMHDGPVTAMDVNPSASHAVTVSRDGTGILWEFSQGNEDSVCAFQPVHKWAMTKEEEAVLDIKFLAKHRFATCTSGFVIQVWKIGATSLPKIVNMHAYTKQRPVGLIFTGKKLFAFTLSGNLLMLNLDTLSQIVAINCSSDWIQAATPMCGNVRIAVVNVDRTMVFCEPPKSSTTKSHLFRHSNRPKDTWPMAVCALESDSVLVGDSEGFISEYLGNGNFVMQKRLHGRAITSLLALGGGVVVTASEDSTVKIWQLNQGPSSARQTSTDWKQIRQFYSTSPVTSLCSVDPQSFSFLVGNKLGQVHLLRMLP